MKLPAAVSVLLLSLTVAPPAIAQNDVCYLRVQGQWTVDPKGTKAWLEALKHQDDEVMKQMAGVWYGEVVEPTTGAVSYQWKQYDENGLFQYQARTCSTAGFCSDNTGHGFYTGSKNGDGSLALFFIINDLERDHECSGGYSLMLDSNRMQDALGLVWQRVQ